jgi:hypothetical protein
LLATICSPVPLPPSTMPSWHSAAARRAPPARSRPGSPRASRRASRNRPARGRSRPASR